MSISLSILAVSVALAALSALLGPGDAQAKIKCGSILGPGGTYVLDRNLTCPSDKPSDELDYADRVGVLKLIGGAKLNLNGHTVSCRPSYTDTPPYGGPWGIVVRNSTLQNGIVRGCSFGVIASNSLVKGMTLDGNFIGVMLREKYGSGGNLIVGNTATNNQYGFSMVETAREMLTDNFARDNGVGFSVEASAVVLVGNVALRNQAGFQTFGSRGSAGPTELVGNRAEENGCGFLLDGVGEVTGNIAKNNVAEGFVVDPATGLDRMRDNVARGNGGDGFQLRLDRLAGTLSSNHAINNQGHGVHVVDGLGQSLGGPTATITGNTAIRNVAGDLADDTDCRLALWVANRFGTAAQPCIH